MKYTPPLGAIGFLIYEKHHKMKAFIEKDNKKIDMKYTGTVKDLLNKLKINPETVIVTRDNELVSDDDKLTNDDNIKILSVISGG